MRLYLAASTRQDAAERHARLLDARVAAHADGEGYAAHERALRRASGVEPKADRKVIRVTEPPKLAARKGR